MTRNSARHPMPLNPSIAHDDLPASTRFLPKPPLSSRSRLMGPQPLSVFRIFFDTLAFILVVVAWLLFKYLVKPVRRAFLCSDLNLYRPSPPENVIPVWLLFVLAVAVPAMVIIISETIRWFYLRHTKAARAFYEFRIRARVFSIPQWFGNMYMIMGAYVFAHAINSFLTNLGKVAVGRLRPHFIPSCFHQFSYHGFCTDPNDWIVNYTCIGESSGSVKEKDGIYDIRQSFPSGHSSTAFCGLIFLAFYVHHVWNYRNLGLFPYLIEATCFGLASYIGMTRITDNRHHPTDVLAGALLGTLIAWIAIRFVIKSFKRSICLEKMDQLARDRFDVDNGF